MTAPSSHCQTITSQVGAWPETKSETVQKKEGTVSKHQKDAASFLVHLTLIPSSINVERHDSGEDYAATEDCYFYD